ncbi:MAG TPA: dienelactone hydrolase family protein [Candidatus Limnocylindrales bacterium]|jgi:carboxymethylenebutenolidase|nr:dienelactone hydrolase family protein [Candidatus Limnocylindrales bacterium]
MCFDHDSRPPLPPIAGGAVEGRRVDLVADDNVPFLGFLARADQPTGAGVIILPDVRGLHGYYEELALRFAEAGVDALAVDYFGRTTRSSDRGPDFPFRDHIAQTTYPGLLDDLSGAAHRLRDEAAPRALFTIGFCFGGRLSFLCATRPELELAGVIGFYGWPVGDFRAGMPAPAEVAPRMRVPVLAIFGEADDGIPAQHRAAFEAALAGSGVEHELATYAGAPHSFFDRKAEEFADDSADAWRRVLEFVARLTPAAG